MILKGIVEETFGGRTLFRGYATLKSLAMISTPAQYQRDIDTNRIDEIKSFFSEGTFRFFPELIFGLEFPDDDALKHIKDVPGGKKPLSNGLKITKGKFRFNNVYGANPKTKSMSIDFPKDERPLSRIDGNHRLKAVDEILQLSEGTPEALALQQEIGNMVVPFSMLLQTKSDEAKKYETAFYFLINSKSVPLTSNDNLKAILDGKCFSPNEQERLIGPFAETIEDLVSCLEQYNSIKKIFENRKYEFLLDLFQLQFAMLPSKEQVLDALAYANHQYYANKKLACCDINILLVLLYYRITDEKLCDKFIMWVIENSISTLKEVAPSNIIAIFDKTNKKGPYKVFVAMPYVSFKRVNEFNKLFKEVLQEVSANEKVEVELIPIMRFRGAAQRIDQRLIKCIKECDLFIADLTGGNENVLFEVGLAEGNNKPMILLRAENDTISKVPFEIYAQYAKDKKIPFDMNQLQWVPYSVTGDYNDIKSIVRNNLPEILRQKYGEIK
ncbi:MAG: hypothetical protein VB126_05535 [Paludibacter sp.]|nr:hypothetical protein [Paludibacter sp.]